MKDISESISLLLQMGERVIAVGPDIIISAVWKYNEFSMLQRYMPSEQDNDVDGYIVRHCAKPISEAFNSGKPGNAELLYSNGTVSCTYQLRILIHQSNEVLIVVNEAAPYQNWQNENKWKMALDASGDGVWDIDMVSSTISFSDKWHEIFGYNSEDIVTVPDWAEKIHPDDLEIAEQQVADHLAGKKDAYSAEVRYRCKNGNYKWILSRGVVISRSEKGTPLRFIGTHKDIHTRKMAEIELSASREVFANSFNHSGIGKAILAPGGKWIEVNDIICNWTEYTKAELQELHYRDITYPEDIDIDLPLIQKLLTGEIPAYTIEKRYVSKSRKIIVTLLTVTVVWEGPGIPKFFNCDIVDITALREMANQITRKNQEMAMASSSLEARIKQLEELNHIIAHNLRGPVNNIKLLSHESDLFSEKEALAMIRESSVGLLNELEQLLHLSSIQLNSGIPRDTCNFSAIIKDISNQLQGILYEKNVSIEANIMVPNIHYPRVYLESILYNLLSNAIKYGKAESSNTICVTTFLRNGKTVLSVKDNGIGIDLKKHRDDLFKLNKVFHKGYDSKGIGLFITKTQIETLGGSISVASQPGEGTEFIVVF